jgi:hypothetical protein
MSEYITHLFTQFDICSHSSSKSIPLLEDWVGGIQPYVSCAQCKCVCVICVLCAHCRWLHSHPSLFAVSLISGVTPKIRIHYSDCSVDKRISELFNSLNRYLRSTAWCSRNWRRKEAVSFHISAKKRKTPKSTKTMLWGVSQFTDFYFLQGVLEHNPCKKWGMTVYTILSTMYTVLQHDISCAVTWWVRKSPSDWNLSSSSNKLSKGFHNGPQWYLSQYRSIVSPRWFMRLSD